MKIFYHNNEVGVPMKEAKVIDLFKDNIKFSKNNIVACRCNNEIKSYFRTKCGFHGIYDIEKRCFLANVI